MTKDEIEKKEDKRESFKESEISYLNRALADANLVVRNIESAIASAKTIKLTIHGISNTKNFVNDANYNNMRVGNILSELYPKIGEF